MKIYLIDGKRSAIGSFLGSLSDANITQIGATVLKDLIYQKNFPKEIIDEIIIGNVLSAGLKQGPSRQVALQAGLSEKIPAYGVNMICGSGLKAIHIAYANIKAGLCELVIAGGIESMSSAPMLLSGKIRKGFKIGGVETMDHMLYDALTDYTGFHMGVTAENIAEKLNITRKEQDAFAFESQKKAHQAISDGKFKNEITPLEIKTRKSSFIFDTDEHPKLTSLEKLSTLNTVFKKNGTVTAGNASGINDGAAMTLVASEETVEKYKLTPIAEIISMDQAGIQPEIMGLAPVPAINKTLKRANLSLQDIDIIELNEAFAAQSLGVIAELIHEHKVSTKWIMERINVNGGAIALGHPVGMSGARIVVSLAHEMKKRNSKYGLASLCIGGGMGISIILQKP